MVVYFRYMKASLSFDTKTLKSAMLSDKKFQHLNKIRLACHKPPLSCCLNPKDKDKPSMNDFKGNWYTQGDYIMVNDKLNINIANTIPIPSDKGKYPAKNAGSDHLPVFMQVFEEKTAKSKSADKPKHTETKNFTVKK